MIRNTSILSFVLVLFSLNNLLADEIKIEVDAETYRKAEWDIYETSHHENWLGDLPFYAPDFID